MRKSLRLVILFGAPLFTGIINSFHPRHAGVGVYHGIVHHVDWWITLHLLNLGAFALIGLAAYLLLDDTPGWCATLGRVAVAVYVPLYVGFDTLAGIGTGVLIRHAAGLPPEQLAVISPAIDHIWSGKLPLALGVAGSVAWIVAMVASAVAFTAPGRKTITLALAIVMFGVVGWGTTGSNFRTLPWWIAAAALAAACLALARPGVLVAGLLLSALFFGTTHVVPYGPIAMACFLVAIMARLRQLGSPRA